MNEWQSDLFPSNVTFRHPRLRFWTKRYSFLKNIDISRIYLMLNWDAQVDRVVLGPNHRVIVFTSCAESPRYPEVRELALRYPNILVLWLADIQTYDYPLPANVLFITYRHWYVRLEMFQECYQGIVPRVKNKTHKYKFSSLSYFRRPSRAVVTAALYTYARSSSLFTWRNIDNDPSGTQAELINTFRNHRLFKDMDWKFFDQDFLMAQDNIADIMQTDRINFNVRDSMLNVDNIAFGESLININNETDTFGWMDNGIERYNRPGPFLTEKTWKTLITGCALLSSGQPGTMNFLREAYRLPLDYSYDTSYDLEIKDFDRFAGLVETIQNIEKSSLCDLIDANIDTCQRIQDLVLDPDYIKSMRDYNLAQDEKILELLAQWI